MKVTSLKQVSENRNPRRMVRIDSELLARAQVIGKPNRLFKTPFQFPSFPKQIEDARVAHDIPALAQDDALSSVNTWGRSDAISSAYAEGVVFLGFAYLAQLAQRSEYRVVTETIASEMTREWIELKAASGEESKSKKIKKITDFLDKLDVKGAFKKAVELDGYFGRGHIYLDTGVTKDNDELVKDLGDGRSIMSTLKVGSKDSRKKQRLIAVRPVEPMWAYPTRYESNDPLSADWYKPVTWFVMSREIHRSRFLTFVGREVSDVLKPAYAFGGLSMSQMLKPYVDNFLRTRQSVSDLIANFAKDILHINMDATTSTGGNDILDRIAFYNLIKNSQGTMVLDKESEDFSNVSTPLSGLDTLQAQAREQIAAVARTPIVKLFGIQPAGLNASSEGELITWEDWVAAFQEAFFRPNLTKVIDFAQLTLFDEVDQDITFGFKPLRQDKPMEREQRQQIKAATREVYSAMGAVDASEVREAVAHDEESPFDGVDLDKPLEQPPGFDPLTGEAPPVPGEGGSPPGTPSPGTPSPGTPSPSPPGPPSNDATGVELESVEALRSFASKKLGADGKPNRFKRGKG
jgi:uncharacterized protein